MVQYLVRRLLWAFVLFLAVTVVTFVIFYVIPANPAQLVAGKSATQEDIDRAEKFLGTDKPVYVQYIRFLNRLSPFGRIETAPGDYGGWGFKEPSLGTSFATRQEVNDVVFRAAPVTASLVFGGAILWMLISVPIGVFSALRPRSLLDRAAMVFVLIGISAHPVWIGLILAYVFGYKLGWFPITGYCDMINPGTDCGGPVDWAWHLMLPWTAFAILFAAQYVRMIRANTMETLNEDYVRTARAKGAPEGQVLRSHVLRNSLLVIVTMLGMDIALALGGAIFTESVFGLPGLGKTALESINAFDLPITMGIVVFATLAIIVFNLIVDLVYAAIDPRIRLN
ncbi:MAG TPA: ABC transporter permease [Gaiellaceae bacterium]|jgi:peptide/nickel transport system permease protein